MKRLCSYSLGSRQKGLPRSAPSFLFSSLKRAKSFQAQSKEFHHHSHHKSISIFDHKSISIFPQYKSFSSGFQAKPFKHSKQTFSSLRLTNKKSHSFLSSPTLKTSTWNAPLISSLPKKSPTFCSTNPTPPNPKPNTTKEKKHTHFGFSEIPEDEKEQKVGQVFHSVAEKYDLMNDLMSGGLHRLWKSEFLNILHPTPGMKLLDVAGGTGDIAFKFLERVQQSNLFVENVDQEEEKTKVVVCDINASMLKVGEQRAIERGYHSEKNPSIEWVEGNAEKLPFQDGSFDAYTIAFGIRNCTHIPKVLEEAHRVLKVGGKLVVLEFSHVDKDNTLGAFGNSILSQIYETYSFNVIPEVGKLVTGDRDSYQYLVESIRKFPNQQDFAKMIKDQGFKRVDYQNLTFGVVAIHSGYKL